MFSSALKSFSSNITSNYSIAPQPNSTSGPWKIFDGKRKSTGRTVSIFVFDRKSIEPPAGGSAALGGRSNGPSLKKAQQDVVARLKQEAGALARLRHPSILELVEPVEETRNGGLMFATEQVTASLSSLLADLDERERNASGSRIRGAGRYTVQDAESGNAAKEFELDELEIQKGLLQVGRGLEFLHDSAGLVHGNLTPASIIVNAKGDWKISGMGFAGSMGDPEKPSSFPAIYLPEILNHDPRLPQIVQLDLDYSSPDFVMDENVNTTADIFSLGLISIALYNSPHRSPVDCHGSLSSYKRIFSSPSSVPSQNNNFLVKGKLPSTLATELLPKLITRRPATRLTAKAFQQAQYFDNILVSTVRFIDELPGKSPVEKSQFLKGLPRIMPQFPTSILEKKLLPALMEEMKDKNLLSAILQNVFAIIQASADGKRPFIELVIPKLREVFLQPATKAAAAERDSAKEAGLMIVLQNMQTISDNTSGKEFRDDILPIIGVGLHSSTHAIVDTAINTLSLITPKLDYSTIKNELFPVIATVFTQTNSLAIKIQGLGAFYSLCGGTAQPSDLGDGLDGAITMHKDQATSSAVLDKFTIQEKVVPLLKGIKTKEPAVMLAALKLLEHIGHVVDTDFIATDILPVLWSFALGPLLDLAQFQAFMRVIKALTSRIEREHGQKLQELRSSNNGTVDRISRSHSSIQPTSANVTNGSANDEIDFESLVTGRKSHPAPDMLNDWTTNPTPARPSIASNNGPSWSANITNRPNPTQHQTSMSSMATLRPHVTSSGSNSRSITPDLSLSSFASLTPSSAFTAPLQPTSRVTPMPMGHSQQSIQVKPNYDSQRVGAERPHLGSGSMSSGTFTIPPPSVNGAGLLGRGQQGQHIPSPRMGQARAPQARQANGLEKYDSLL